MSWLYLALLATAFYAAVNLLDDNLLHFVYKSPYIAATSTGIYGALPLLSRLFISAPGMRLSLAVISVLAGCLTLGYLFFYFRGLQFESPSVVVALFSLAPVTLPFLAHFIVQERLTQWELSGFALVLMATLGLSITSLESFVVSRALLPVAIAVVLMDAASIMTKYVYQRADFYTAYLYFCVGMGIAGICCFLIKVTDNKRALREIVKNGWRLLPVFIAAELTGLAAEFTLNLAISQGPVSLVKVVEGVQPVFVLLITLALYPLAPRYFREAEDDRPWRKFALMAAAVAGLAIISVSSGG